MTYIVYAKYGKSKDSLESGVFTAAFAKKLGGSPQSGHHLFEG